MRSFLQRIGSRFRAGSEPYFMAENRQYDNHDIGEGSYGYPEIVFYDAGAKLKIGRYCAIAPKVTILLGGEHHHDWVSGYPFSLLHEEARDVPGYPLSKGNVSIGDDVWIGYETLILSGVTIGEGSVIAARSLVTKNVEPFSVVGRVPASHIRYRFPEETIASLRRIAWWNWPRNEIEANWDLIQSPDVDGFIKKFDPEYGN